jgi:hypothetical protein
MCVGNYSIPTTNGNVQGADTLAGAGILNFPLQLRSAELHGVTLKDHNLITLSSFTPTPLTTTFTDKITFRQNCQHHCSVQQTVVL